MGELLDGTIGPEDCPPPIREVRFIFLSPIAICISNRIIGSPIA